MEGMTSNLVDRKTLAARLGISVRRVGQLIHEKKISEGPGGIDLAKALGEYALNCDRARVDAHRRRIGAGSPVLVPPAAGEPAKPSSQAAAPGGPIGLDDQTVFDFNNAKARKEHFNAEIARARLTAMAGTMISRESVKAKEFAVARKLRDRLLGIPARLANFVSPEAMKNITDEIDTLIRELQEDCARIAEDAAGPPSVA